MTVYDVIVAGGGPGGAVCAAHCAKAGLKTLVLERSAFPREKVCGDCLNPACWPILDRLDLSDAVLALPHSRFRELEFVGISGRSIRFSLPGSSRGELAVKRSLLDDLLLRKAAECGAEIRQETAVKSIATTPPANFAQGASDDGASSRRAYQTSGPLWRIEAGPDDFMGKILVAADGRNSSVARLLGVLPSPRRERVALQAHVPGHGEFEGELVLRFLKQGYCGIASLGGGEINLCLVGTPDAIPRLKEWGEKNLGISPDYSWRTVTPLARAPIAREIGMALFVGDAARVVEPFTGEGIAYALASGELAATHIIHESKNGYQRGFAAYSREHRAIYKGRLWINELAKQAVLHPRIGNIGLRILRQNPWALRFLAHRVIGPESGLTAA